MNNNSLSNLPAVRLASGVEPQQKWPIQEHGNLNTTKPGSTKEGPKLIELSPSHGDDGTIVTVVVQALPPQVPVKLAFNSLMVDTKQLQAQGITSLVATVPAFQQTHSATPNVPISICFLDKDMVTETWMVADFTYNSTENVRTKSPAANVSSYVNVSYNDRPTNTASPTVANAFQPKDNNDFLNSSAAAYQNFYSSSAVNSPYGFGAQVPGYQQYAYQQQQQQHRDIFVDKYNQQNNNRPYNGYNNSALNLFPSAAGAGGFTGMLTAGGLDQTGSATATVTAPTTPSSTMSAMSSNYASPAQSTPHTPQQPQPRPRQSNTANNAVFGFKSTTHTPATSVANYQPYPGLISRANLDIMGDLDAMAKNWTSEEWDHRRRLVQFWREQHSNKITTSFQPVPQGERASNSGNIVVSCIYWMERNDFFITSVDCIYLLECLMDIRFSVEEKNRIRRNLEGFRPLTVSKCKAESADFFKLIMSFPNPKPRNIEKDVKVFPWKTLPYALKKIVTKYTASSYNNIGMPSQKMNQQANQRSADNTSAPTAVTTSILPPIPSTATVHNTNDNPNLQPPQSIDSFYQTQQKQDQTNHQHHPDFVDNSQTQQQQPQQQQQTYSHGMYHPSYYEQQQQQALQQATQSQSQPQQQQQQPNSLGDNSHSIQKNHENNTSTNTSTNENPTMATSSNNQDTNTSNDTTTTTLMSPSTEQNHGNHVAN
ncbi:MAG: hypothetical protein EXX96DRAFT_572321 [Benjaminiella poitrasii]|nr:MAG: hypothetical protein EXX96DRAFT_572321 [Benjaminiella poitrasii]